MHVALTARYYGRTGHRHLDTRRVAGVVPGLTRVEVNRVPKGVVGIISPWNYPFTLALCDGLPALLAGNAVVHKPDAQTMLTALMGVQLLEEAGFPKDLWQVVAGPGREIGPGDRRPRRLRLLHRLDRAPAGRSRKQCADRLVGCSLELGGKNPILVLRDADLDRAAEGAVRASFSNAGQLCVSTERMFVADQVYDRFVDRFVARVKAMQLQPGLAWGSDMGSLISPAAARRRHRARRGRPGQGRPGARRRPRPARPRARTTTSRRCSRGSPRTWPASAHETFGPVVSVYRFADEADAVARANDGQYGLNASVYTQDGARGRAVARQIKCGTVNVNEAFAATFASIDAPMGGMRESGLGRRQGAEGVLRYTETQSVATQRLLRFGPMFGLTDERLRPRDDRAARAAQEARPQVSGTFDFDVLVVGSGFGGSVTALRLTEKGYRVGVLEAGARFADEDLPTTSWDLQTLPVPPRGRLLRHPARSTRSRTA